MTDKRFNILNNILLSLRNFKIQQSKNDKIGKKLKSREQEAKIIRKFTFLISYSRD